MIASVSSRAQIIRHLDGHFTTSPGLFGYSRGAYAARALAGMLHAVGLLPKGMHEQVDFAYNIWSTGDQYVQ